MTNILRIFSLEFSEKPRYELKILSYLLIPLGVDGRRVVNSNFGIMARHLYCLLNEKVVGCKLLYLLAAKLSLVPVHFMSENISEKNDD